MFCLHVNNKLQLSIKLKHTFSLHDQVKTCNCSISFLRICLAYFNIKFEYRFKPQKDHILQQTTAPPRYQSAGSIHITLHTLCLCHHSKSIVFNFPETNIAGAIVYPVLINPLTVIAIQKLSTREQTKAEECRCAKATAVIVHVTIVQIKGCGHFLKNWFLYLELSHHRGIVFLIFGLSSLKFESAAEICETLELCNLFEFTVINLKIAKHNNHITDWKWQISSFYDHLNLTSLFKFLPNYVFT